MLAPMLAKTHHHFTTPCNVLCNHSDELVSFTLLDDTMLKTGIHSDDCEGAQLGGPLGLVSGDSPIATHASLFVRHL